MQRIRRSHSDLTEWSSKCWSVNNCCYTTVIYGDHSAERYFSMCWTVELWFISLGCPSSFLSITWLLSGQKMHFVFSINNQNHEISIYYLRCRNFDFVNIGVHFQKLTHFWTYSSPIGWDWNRNWSFSLDLKLYFYQSSDEGSFDPNWWWFNILMWVFNMFLPGSVILHI